jgi:hypothetical protein
MRETRYAKELATASHSWPTAPGEEARVERLFIKEQEAGEIRFSWWKDGNIVPRPLDISEADMISLIAKGVRAGVFSPAFLARLIVAVGQEQ